MEEIRDAIKNVRAAGKKVYAFSDSMNRGSLFLASACDSIFMPVSSDLTFIGMGSTQLYIKGLLDKLDIRPNIHRIADYKSAAEPVLRTDMSPEAREMYTWLIDSLWKTEMHEIAEDRGLTENQLTDFMDFALFTADQAKEAGLIDGVLYWDEVDSLLRNPDDDELTRTRKLRRAFVEKRYGDIVEALYSDKDLVHIDTTITYEDGRKSHIKTDLRINSIRD